MTGARVPKGADTIVKVELTDRPKRERWSDSSEISVLEPVAAGTSIVRRGSEVKKGKLVLAAGQMITGNNISIPAAFGYAKVRVAKQPRVAIMSTGSEIVEIKRKPGRDQIRNSNSVMLKTLVNNCGGTAQIHPIATDDLSDLKSHISTCVKNSDLVIITGGVSVGKYDLTKTALAELGAEIFFEKVRLKPGKPTVFGKVKKTVVFGLPGNPVSSAVTFYLFVRMALLRMQGAEATSLLHGHALLAHTAKAARERDTYLPSVITSDAGGRVMATPLNWQGSSDFIGFGTADSLIYLPAGRVAESGEVVEVVFL